MSGRGASNVFESECFTETCDDTILSVLTMDKRQYDVVFMMFLEETAQLRGDIIDITVMLSFSDKTHESFTATETDRAFCGDTASEESYVHR